MWRSIFKNALPIYRQNTRTRHNDWMKELTLTALTGWRIFPITMKAAKVPGLIKLWAKKVEGKYSYQPGFCILTGHRFP